MTIATGISEADIGALRASGQFDEQWYLEQYPDVRALGMDPAEHYLWMGKRLGRKQSNQINIGTQQRDQRSPQCISRGPRDPLTYFTEIDDRVPQDSNYPVTRLMSYIWRSRPDLQSAFKLESQTDRERFCHWFSESVEREYGFPAAAFTAVASLGRGGETKMGADQAQQQFQVGPARITEALRSSGANLIGYAKGELGMGEHIRMVASSLKEVTVPFDLVNVRADGHGQQDDTIDAFITQRQRFAMNIFHINSDMYPLECLRHGVGFYNIGYWAWELPNCPPEFDVALDLVEEIWACSQFTAESFRARANVPVISMPLAVEVPSLSPAIYNKARYRLPAGRFAFLFTFDASSYLDRKNPVDVVRAFKRAFPTGDEKVHLVFKVQNTAHIVGAGKPAVFWNALLEEIGDSPRVTIIDKRFSREEVFGLSLACDAFVSLHRSEGFGRNLTEAMSYGKPVIATNWSGSCEFIREDTACAIDYQLIPVPAGSYPFSEGQHWAQPDVDNAAWAMRKLVEDDEFRVKKAKAGRRFVLEHFNKTTIGMNYKRRLDKISRRISLVALGSANDVLKEAVNDRERGGSTALFTITSKNYVSYARTVLQSIAAYHPEYVLFLCLADEISDGFDPSSESFTIIPANKLGIPNFLDMTIRYDILEFNTAVKPFMFRWIMDNTNVKNIIYFDPDLYLYRPLDDLTEMLDNGTSVALTPHVTEPLIDDQCSPNDHAIMKAGVFNLGFIAVRRCDEAKHFIEWWGTKLLTGACADFANNLFNDQRWCDLVPCFLPNLKIIRDRTYNVAYWNLPHRDISKDDEGNFLVNGQPLTFFHFSGVNPKKIDAVSKHQNRFCLDDLSEACKDLFKGYGNALLSNGWEAALKFPYCYNRLDGLEIQPMMRLLYRSVNPQPRHFMDVREAKGYLLDICNCQSPTCSDDDRSSVSEIMLLIYRLRPDLQKVFSLSTDDGRRKFRDWFRSSGPAEYGLPPQIVGT